MRKLNSSTYPGIYECDEANKRLTALSKSDSRETVVFGARFRVFNALDQKQYPYMHVPPSNSMEAGFGDDPHDPAYLQELEDETERQPGDYVLQGPHDEVLESNRPPQHGPGFGNALLSFKERANSGERGVPKKGGKRTARRKGTTKKQKSKKNKRQSRRILRRASSRKGRK